MNFAGRAVVNFEWALASFMMSDEICPRLLISLPC